MHQQEFSHEQFSPLTTNDIIQLANFIQSAFEHFSRCQSSCEDNYLANLSVIVDCYSLVLLEAGYLTTQDDHFNSAKSYALFKQYPHLTQKFAFTFADMINRIAERARLMDHLWFYPHFINAIKTLLSPKMTYFDDEIEMATILQTKILNHRKSFNHREIN